MSDARATGVLWGQLLTGIETARSAVDLARRGESLLSEPDRAALREVRDMLAGVEQRAWAAATTPAKPRRKRAR